MAAGPPVPAAAAAPGLTTPSTIQKTAPGWENTMAVKDGKVSLLLLVLQLLLFKEQLPDGKTPWQ